MLIWLGCVYANGFLGWWLVPVLVVRVTSENSPVPKRLSNFMLRFGFLKFSLIRHVYLPIPVPLHFCSVHAYHTCQENAYGEFATETIVLSRQRLPQLSAIGMRFAGGYPSPCYLQKTTRVRDETLAYPKNAAAVPASSATILAQTGTAKYVFFLVRRIRFVLTLFCCLWQTHLCFLRVCTTPYRPGG